MAGVMGMSLLSLVSLLCVLPTAAALASPSFVEKMMSDTTDTEKNTLNMTVQMLGMDTHGEHVVGHLVKIANPAGHLSLQLPHGTCGHRAKTSETAAKQAPACKLAINAGYFNVHTSACIGNVVSHGHVLQTVPRSESNVNFGVKDGHFFIGYVDASRAGDFTHLVSGVGWLVHEGRNVIREEWKRANWTVETSGKAYISKVASRTSIGFDEKGGLIIVQVDGSVAEGEERPKGVNMTELADLLIEHGAVEGINLDGGGSSSMVHDGVIINYPSDRKPPSCLPGMEYHCERPVSSILCVQEYQDQEDMIFERYWAFSSLLVVPRILPLMFLICLSCVGGFVIARVALKRHPAHAKQRAFLREEGVNNLSSDEEANMSSSDNCGVSKGWHD